MPLKPYLKERQRLVDAALRRFLPRESVRPTTIHKAMRHPDIGGTRCRTRDLPLPGAVDLDAARKRILAFPGLPTACAARLISVYGSRGEAVAALAQGHPGFVDDEQTVLIAEVIHAIRFEQAVALTDIVHRRLMT